MQKESNKLEIAVKNAAYQVSQLEELRELVNRLSQEGSLDEIKIYKGGDSFGAKHYTIIHKNLRFFKTTLLENAKIRIAEIKAELKESITINYKSDECI